MLKNSTIAFIGPGVMAEAMIAGLVREKLAKPENILAAGPRVNRGRLLEKEYGLKSLTDNKQAATQADILVLSVKPQTLESVLPELSGGLRKEAIVVSIIAGAPIQRISNGLQHKAVVRAMPNTPARIGAGITVWTAAKEATEEQKDQARKLLTALGEEIYMGDESFLDKATALSGTGPAYVYLFMEAMVDAGVHLGFPRRIAEQLVVQTIRGSVEFYDAGGEDRHLAQLRNQVTSPGGTSAEALYFLEKAGFRTAISRAIWAAYNRSTELGQGLAEHSPE
jgi:pyrroline-5-carboxylate reductase